MKVAMVLSFLGLAVLGGYLFYSSKEESMSLSNESEFSSGGERTQVEQMDQAVPSQQILSPNDYEKLSPSQELIPVGEGEEDNVLSSEDLEQLEEIFEEAENRWSQGVESIFVQQYGLPQEVYQQYQKMRDEYDEAKLLAFEEYHERMLKQHGPDYEIKPSDMLEAFSSPVEEIYSERLRALVGDEAYKGYLSFKDQFNEDLRAGAESRLGLFLIDF